MDTIGYWTETCAPVLRARLASHDRVRAIAEFAFLLALIGTISILALAVLGGEPNPGLNGLA